MVRDLKLEAGYDVRESCIGLHDWLMTGWNFRAGKMHLVGLRLLGCVLEAGWIWMTPEQEAEWDDLDKLDALAETFKDHEEE